jgi:predicted RNA binding protein YcfA (HicA-like mRNA interferase family)
MKLPVVSGQELIKALSKVGFELDHATGSHAILRRNAAPHARITVPLHSELAKGTLRAIMRQAGLTHEQLSELL